ncbi:MAG: methyltransferase family protein [Gammaproteobacteria bacterium]
MKEDLSDIPGVAAPPPLIYAGGFALGYLVEKYSPTASFPEFISAFVGWSLIAFGVLIAAFALSAFRRAGTPVNPYAQTTALVTGGPFRFSRNPLYLALTVIYLGAAGLLNSLWPVLLLPAVLWFMHWGVIIREERYLERKFGPAYQEYKARVRRWL